MTAGPTAGSAQAGQPGRGVRGAAHLARIGVAIDDIAKSTTGRMLILGPQNVTQLNNA